MEIKETTKLLVYLILGVVFLIFIKKTITNVGEANAKSHCLYLDKQSREIEVGYFITKTDYDYCLAYGYEIQAEIFDNTK
jgi:hypothetical protein